MINRPRIPIYPYDPDYRFSSSNWALSNSGNPLYFGEDFFAVVYESKSEKGVWLFGIIERTGIDEDPSTDPAFYRDVFFDEIDAKAAAIGALHATEAARTALVNRLREDRKALSFAGD